jgi:catechol 2,3-dioxygenase-like lactoylglutathione lyase family enzyme
VVADPLEALRLPIVPVEPRPEFADDLLRRLSGEAAARDSASVRYFVSDLGSAVAFYRDQLGFQEEINAGGGFAMLYRGDLRLLLSTPGGTHQLPDGTVPEPGGWNRIALRVADIESIVEALRTAGVRFRTGIVENPAVRNALVEDPSGNPVELFQPTG